MEKLLNHYGQEYLTMAMLKHEVIFRQQVHELHRLYRIQKVLMKDRDKNSHEDNPYMSASGRPEPRPADVCSVPGSGVELRVSEAEDDDHSDLELTLGPKIYYQKKIVAAGPALASDSGPSFSSPFSGSSHVKGLTRSTAKGDCLSQQKWGPEIPARTNQDRLNGPPWLFHALSLNITSNLY